MKNSQIKIQNFRKCFGLSSTFVKNVCKALDIEIYKIGEEQVIPLYNQILQKNNDTLLLYAFIESETTGKTESTKRKDFSQEHIDACEDKTNNAREDYLLTEEVPSEGTIIKKPKDAIDVSSTSDLDLKKEEFINILAEVVAKSVANQSKSVLNTQEELHNAMKRKWLLTNEQLATLLGMSKSTISSKPDNWVRMGFRYTKIKEGNLTLWKVSQYDLR